MSVIGAFRHLPVDGEPLKFSSWNGESNTFHEYIRSEARTLEYGVRLRSKDMEAEKRKNKENDAVSSKARKRERDRDAGEMAVNEEEVEEFYAILRRIRAAVAYFEKSTGDGRQPATKGSTWREGLENEILEEVKKCGAGGAKLKRIEDVEENVGFDLNADPDSGDNADHVDFV